MQRNVYEGFLIADDNAVDGSLHVRVTKADQAIKESLDGKRVRITVEIIDNNETFEELVGVPAEVMADERDEIES